MKGMRIFLSIFIIALMTSSLSVQAQDVSVEISFGMSWPEKTEMSKKVEGLLTSLNRWQQDGIESFIDETGVQAFKEIAEELQLIAQQPNLTVGAYRLGDQIRLTPIYLENQMSPDKKHGITFVFDKDGTFLDALRKERENSVFRLSAQAVPVKNPPTYSLLSSVLDNYRDAIEGKNAEHFKSILSEDAEIISGTWNPDEQVEKYEYRQQEAGEYVKYITNEVFHPGNQVQVILLNTEFYKDVEHPNLYLISTYQIWHSSYYSDGGQLLLLVDTSGGHPIITARYWFEKNLNLRGFYPMDVRYTLVKNPIVYQQVERSLIAEQESPGEVELRKSKTNADISESKGKTFFTRKRMWLIGGVVGAAAGSAILLTGGDSSGSSIPIPPGRPGAN